MFCSLLSKSTTEKNPIDPKRACDDKFSKVTYKGDLYSEAEMCKKTWQNKHRGLEGIRKGRKELTGTIWQGGKRYVLTTLVCSEGSEHCYLWWEIWSASKELKENRLFILSHKNCPPSSLTLLHATHSQFIIWWFA